MVPITAGTVGEPVLARGVQPLHQSWVGDNVTQFNTRYFFGVVNVISSAPTPDPFWVVGVWV